MCDELKRLTKEIPELEELYLSVEEVRSNELVAAEKGTKVAHTRMRLALSNIAKLSKVVRKKILERAKAL